MMKFTISSKKSSSRTGIFHLLPSESGSSSRFGGYEDLETDSTSANPDFFDLKVETPNVLVYTRYGRIPHLTADIERSLLGERTPQVKRIRLSEL